MKLRTFPLLLLIGLISLSCTKKNWVVTEAKSQKIPIDASTDDIVNQEYTNYLEPFKEYIDIEMRQVIGTSEMDMDVKRPESLLSNLNADIYRIRASQYLNKKVDIGIVNIGSLRTNISKGEITIGTIFELMPFENELVILWLKGDKIEGLCQFFASIGGEGVSGIKMGIDKGKAVNILINGAPLNVNKTYIVATNEYLAEGNDNMVQLAEYEKREDTGLKIRDVLIDYVREETSKGNKITSKMEGRIYVK